MPRLDGLLSASMAESKLLLMSASGSAMVTCSNKGPGNGVASPLKSRIRGKEREVALRDGKHSAVPRWASGARQKFESNVFVISKPTYCLTVLKDRSRAMGSLCFTGKGKNSSAVFLSRRLQHG